MQIENEIKILRIDVAELTKRLENSDLISKGLIYFKRYVYELPENKDAWIRLRTDGTKTTLTYKKYVKDSIDGVKELEIEVSSFEDTNTMLNLMGYNAKNYQENKRTLYSNDEVEISIDEWPQIDPYAEIEGKTSEIVSKYLKEYDLEDNETTSQPTSHVYKLAGLDIDQLTDLHF